MSPDTPHTDTHDDPATEAHQLIDKLADYHYEKGWVEGVFSTNDNTDAAYRRGHKEGLSRNQPTANNTLAEIQRARESLPSATTETRYEEGWFGALGLLEKNLETLTATQPNKTRNNLAMGLYERLQEMGDRHDDRETIETRLEWWQLGWEAAITELTNHLDKETEGEHLTITD